MAGGAATIAAHEVAVVAGLTGAGLSITAADRATWWGSAFPAAGAVAAVVGAEVGVIALFVGLNDAVAACLEPAGA